MELKIKIQWRIFLILVVIIMIKIKTATFYLNMIHVTMYRELNKILTQLVHSVNASVLKSGTIFLLYIYCNQCIYYLYERVHINLSFIRLRSSETGCSKQWIKSFIQWKTSVHWINEAVQKLFTG